MIELGSFLKTSREASGLTQKDLGFFADFSSAQFVSNIERGLCMPSPIMMRVYVDKCGVNSAELIEFMVNYHRDNYKKALEGFE